MKSMIGVASAFDQTMLRAVRAVLVVEWEQHSARRSDTVHRCSRPTRAPLSASFDSNALLSNVGIDAHLSHTRSTCVAVHIWSCFPSLQPNAA